MIVGTGGGEIIEINLRTKKMIKEVMKSHYDKELLSLKINPRNSNKISHEEEIKF